LNDLYGVRNQAKKDPFLVKTGARNCETSGPVDAKVHTKEETCVEKVSHKGKGEKRVREVKT